MTNEEIYEKVMGHKPNKEFGVRGSFGWNDIDALMNEAVKNCSIPNVVGRSEQLKCPSCGSDDVMLDLDYSTCGQCENLW